ncbi:MAG: hypothetical protein HRU34_15785 [Richelia sp.]|nr:hypothetical protein [Richelia sp.]CDN11930.1 ABC-type multidrug transport system, ATPase and permease components [Richelia intracellularis]
MQTKQKVTLYLSPELHKRLKVRSAVDSEPMSELAERALGFYLANSELVDEAEAVYGRAHRVYSCPTCDSSLLIRERELVALGNQPGVVTQESILLEEQENEKIPQDEGELVPC